MKSWHLKDILKEGQGSGSLLLEGWEEELQQEGSMEELLPHLGSRGQEEVAGPWDGE